MVRLEPMSAREWEQWRGSAVRAYAADKVRVGTWSAQDAEARSERAFAELLPEGRDTGGQELRSIVTEAGETVGVVWFAGRTDEMGRSVAFIYDIEVHEASRGRGFGRAALLALEPLARSLGYTAIGLHVFGDNEIARNLYRTSGYVETDVTMKKLLD